MKARPILFNAAMVRALLDGRKTQTRRVVDPTWMKNMGPPVNLKDHGGGDYSGDFNDPYSWGWPHQDDGADMILGQWPDINPYGMPKSRDPYRLYSNFLWVRENCWANKDTDQIFSYCASDETLYDDNYPVKKIPSIHMPRRKSRLTLEITDVRVERLQDIGEDDALAEGLNVIHDGDGHRSYHHNQTEPAPDNFTYPERAYQDLWECINGPDSWNLNPWVWVISFTVHKANIDDVLKGGGR